ncbi:MAG TPA: hypothetical protein VEZ46_17575 [Mycobacteriales bacterium]|nr:hypothetical protein [Mycobacteriales bacterium]
MRLRRPRALDVFVAAVNSLGIGLLVAFVAGIDLAALRASAPSYLLLFVILVFGELDRSWSPGATPRAKRCRSPALSAWCSSWSRRSVSRWSRRPWRSSADDVRRRAPPYKAAFNVAQYTLTLTAARVVYAATSGRSILSDTAPFEARDLLPALLGGLAFLLVNNGLLSIVMALASGTRIRAMVLEEARFLVTSAIVLSLAPVVTAAISFSIWLIPLLLLPIIAVHKAAGLSIRANGRRCTTR